MTEGELMAAVHEYAESVVYAKRGGPVPALTFIYSTEGRAKMLEAIEEYNAEKAADAGLLWIKTADLGLLHAKAAVCDAYREWDYDQIHDERADLRDALSALRKLESK